MTARSDRIGVARYALLLAALVGPSFTFIALPPVLPDIAAHFGGGARGQGIAQLAQVLPFLGLAAGGLVAGWALTRLGARGSVAVSAAGLAAAGAVGLFSNQVGPLLVSCVVIGLAIALATSTLAALTSALVQGARRDRLLGVQVAMSDACTVAGGIAAAVLAARFGWHGPFAIFVAFGVFLLATLAPARVPELASATGNIGLLQVAKLAWPVYLGAGFVFLLATTQATQLPFYLDQLGYRTASSRAVFTTVAVAAAMCGSISFALLLGRVRPWLIQAVAVAAASAGFGGMVFWDGRFGVGVTLVFLAGLASGLTIPTLFAAALGLAPEGLRGHSIGLLNVAIFVGSFISPLLLSPVVAWLGYPGLYATLALAVLVVGAARVVAMRSRAAAERTHQTDKQRELAAHG